MCASQVKGITLAPNQRALAMCAPLAESSEDPCRQLVDVLAEDQLVHGASAGVPFRDGAGVVAALGPLLAVNLVADQLLPAAQDDELAGAAVSHR